MNSSSEIFAIILARGGSKTIPNKNIKNLHTTNCLELTIRSLQTILSSQNILVSSDSSLIGEVAISLGTEFLKRPENLSSDTASSEPAWLHSIEYLYSKNIKPEIILAPQVTSPLRYKETFRKAIKKFKLKNYDSLFSAKTYSNHTFQWQIDRDKKNIFPINYNPYEERKRRQDHDSNSEIKIGENGSFFIFKTEGFIKNSNRLFGKTGYYIQDKLESIEIDDPLDWVLAESVLKNNEDLFIY